MHAATVSRADVSGVSDAGTQDIDDFIYLMSHDVRASVRALLELPQWIVEDLQEAGIEISGSVAQSIELMNRHTARLDRMLVDLLAYSRIGRMPAMGEVDLAQALDTAVAGLKMPAGMRLVRQIGCCAAVMGEQDAILLWSALIGNAIKHHHARDGHIVAETCAEGEMIRLSVSDDGPGIPHHFRARALGAMTTLRPRDEVEGTGMGLAHVSKIAACYGGTVSILDGQGGDGLRIDVLIRRDVRGPLRPDTPPI